MLYTIDTVTTPKDQYKLKLYLVKKFNLVPLWVDVTEVPGKPLVEVTFKGNSIGPQRIQYKFVQWIHKDYNGKVYGKYTRYLTTHLWNWKIYSFTIDISMFHKIVKNI